MGSAESAFYTIYSNHKDKVYRQAWRMTKSHYLAEETVQEVFIRVWLHRDRLSEIKEIASWLHIITRRFVFDHLYFTSRQQSVWCQQPRKTVRIDDDQLERRCTKLMTQAEASLSPRQKQAYQLRYVLGLKKEQIARIMNISPYTAKHHIQNAQTTLRREIHRALAG